VDGSSARIDAEAQAAYLRRLGLDAEPPSVEALQRLHRRHVERVPYETMWLHAGEVWGIDPVDSVTRIARQGRGGYCYHLNGAFSELLRSLGYSVARHVGGVHGPAGPDAEALGNHLVLTVRGLPSDDNPAGIWYVDAGLGDALHEALPLAVGDYEQAPFRLELEQPGAATGDWHLVHDPAGGFPGMSWMDAETEMTAFTAKHEWLSNAADSRRSSRSRWRNVATPPVSTSCADSCSPALVPARPRRNRSPNGANGSAFSPTSSSCASTGSRRRCSTVCGIGS